MVGQGGAEGDFFSSSSLTPGFPSYISFLPVALGGGVDIYCTYVAERPSLLLLSSGSLKGGPPRPTPPTGERYSTIPDPNKKGKPNQLPRGKTNSFFAAKPINTRLGCLSSGKFELGFLSPCRRPTVGGRMEGPLRVGGREGGSRESDFPTTKKPAGEGRGRGGAINLGVFELI